MKKLLIAVSMLGLASCEPSEQPKPEPTPEPTLVVQCDAYITEPSANLRNGKRIEIELKEGESKKLCFELKDEAESVSVLWNDVTDYECNEAQVSFKSTFAPIKESVKSVGASGRLSISKNTKSMFGKPCLDCAKKGIYQVSILSKKQFTKDDPACDRIGVSWYWR